MIEFLLGRNFPHPAGQPLGSTYTMGSESLYIDVKRFGREGNHTPPSSAEVKQKDYNYDSTPPPDFTSV